MCRQKPRMLSRKKKSEERANERSSSWMRQRGAATGGSCSHVLRLANDGRSCPPSVPFLYLIFSLSFLFAHDVTVQAADRGSAWVVVDRPRRYAGKWHGALLSSRNAHPETDLAPHLDRKFARLERGVPIAAHPSSRLRREKAC